jgi:hypothetical protein
MFALGAGSGAGFGSRTVIQSHGSAEPKEIFALTGTVIKNKKTKSVLLKKVLICPSGFNWISGSGIRILVQEGSHGPQKISQV